MKLLKSLLLILSVLFTGCTNDDIPELEVPDFPKGYEELLAAYQQGKVYESASRRFGVCTLNFTDGSQLSVSDLDFMVNDCVFNSPESVVDVNGFWKVGEVTLDVKVDKSLPDSHAYPVYVYYDDMTLNIHLSNGNVLSFWSVALEAAKELEEKMEEIRRYQNIPVVYITTVGGAQIVDKKNYVDGTITIKDPEKLYSTISTYTADMGIRGRGNSTWTWPKKPWKVKLDKAASLLGMPADKEWALLANCSDRTLMRNAIAMKLSEICGFSWTPRMRHVEVYLNDKYQGVYMLCEHKKVSADRINIDVAGEEDNEGEAVTGGYYIEIEAALDEPVNWRTGMGVPLMFSEPEYPTAAQEAYVKKLFADFETCLYSDYLTDPEKGYQSYIDVKSFIDYYIVQELTKNIDGNLFKSAFVTKERGKKMEMYHLWDFDLTMGNCGYFHSQTGSGPENFWIRDFNSYSKPGDNWFNRMMKDPAFVQRLKDRWNELKPKFDEIPLYMDEQALILAEAQERNFEVWDIDFSIDWVMMPSLGSYESEVEYLRKFFMARLNWLDSAINRMQAL